MKKRITSVIALLFVALFLFSSCSRREWIRTVDSLLTPPLYYSEYEGLVEAFNESTGDNVVLCNPTYGDYLSAITVCDLDADQNEEAIIFYRYAKDSLNVRFAIFDCEGDQWVKQGDYIGFGDKVYSLEIKDLDGDQVDEIIVLWCYSAITTTNVITVYRHDNIDKYRQILMDSCEFSDIADFDADDNSEILYISSVNNLGATSKNAHLYKLNEKGLIELGSVAVDSNVISYSNLNEEESTGNTPLKIYIDALKSNNSMVTELLYWDVKTNTLVNPFYDNETASNNMTLRLQPIPSLDINGDGKIEIPVQAVPKEDAPETEIWTDWVCFEGVVPTTFERTYVDLQNGYFIKFNDLENLELFVYKQQGRRSSNVQIYLGQKETGEKLFTISTVPNDDFDEENNDGTVVFNNEDNVVLVTIEDVGKNNGIDEAKLKEIIQKLPL